MSSNYNFTFESDAPKWESFQVNEAFPEVSFVMNVSKKNIIYSVELKIKGHYYCTGSRNFEFDKIEKIVKKESRKNSFEKILNELKKMRPKIKESVQGTVLDIWTFRLLDSLLDTNYKI